MDEGRNCTNYRVWLGHGLGAIQRVLDLLAFHTHRHNNRSGQNDKPRQNEECNGVFVVLVEFDGTENEEKDGEGQSNSV